MKILVVIFLCFAAYGFATNHNGGAVLSLLMVGFTIYANRQLDKRDEEFNNSPAQAKAESDSIALLEEYDCETGRSRL